MARQSTGFGTPGSSGGPSANGPFNNSAGKNATDKHRRSPGLFKKLMIGTAACALLAPLVGYELIKANVEFNDAGGKVFLTQLTDHPLAETIDVGGIAALNSVRDLSAAGVSLKDRATEYLAPYLNMEFHKASEVIPVYIREDIILSGWDDPNSDIAAYRSHVQDDIFRQAKMHHNSAEPLTIFVRASKYYLTQLKKGDDSTIDVMQCHVDPQAPGKGCGKDYREEGADAHYSLYHVTRSLTPEMTK